MSERLRFGGSALVAWMAWTAFGCALSHPASQRDGSADVGRMDADATVREDADVIDVPQDRPGDADTGCAAGSERCGAACVRIDTPDRCGSCTNDCTTRAGTVASGARCIAGRCALECASGLGDCDGLDTNGCEDPLTANVNCGACGTHCIPPAMCVPSREAGTARVCGTTCTAPTVQCAGSCADLSTDRMNCGACGRACPGTARGTSVCSGGSCGIVCDAGFHACMGACVANDSVANCGTTSCSPCPTVANGSAACDGTACSITCGTGFHNCGGSCVGDASPTECGAACVRCPTVANGTAVCNAGVCMTVCAAMFHLCGATCESNMAVASCGTTSCTPCAAAANATPACDGTACGLACTGRFGNCDGLAANGCESNLASDPAHCSACGRSCTSGACASGACVPRGTMANPGDSCLDILSRGDSTGSGTYWLNPGGSGAFQAFCQMTVDGGGWTQLTSAYVARVGPGMRRYLYLFGARWYESPTTSIVWDWTRGQQLTGSYAFFNGTTTGSVACAGSSELPAFGVGCSSGPGATVKVLPIYSSNPAAGTCQICQDMPNAYGVGACTPANAVSVFVR